MRSDLELLDAWRDGDTRAGNELFQRHFEPVYRFFANKVIDGVEDLVQRTFLACTESRDRFRGDASFRTYLFVVARNELYRHRKRGVRDAARLQPADGSLPDIAPSPSLVLAARGEHRLLLEALRRLPLDHQIMLELFYWEGLGGPELAVVLGIAEGTVRSRLRTARTALIDRMRELSDSPDELETTVRNLDDWARSLRDQLPSAVRAPRK